jgi:hypothetical protein
MQPVNASAPASCRRWCAQGLGSGCLPRAATSRHGCRAGPAPWRGSTGQARRFSVAQAGDSPVAVAPTAVDLKEALKSELQGTDRGIFGVPVRALACSPRGAPFGGGRRACTLTWPLVLAAPNGPARSARRALACDLYLMDGGRVAIMPWQAAKKAAIIQLIEALEAQNPVPRPTDNLALAAGDWKLLYSTITITVGGRCTWRWGGLRATHRCAGIDCRPRGPTSPPPHRA